MATTSEYFFENVRTNAGSTDYKSKIELLKNKVKFQRHELRKNECKKEFLKLIQSPNYQSIVNNINETLKKLRENTNKTKTDYSKAKNQKKDIIKKTKNVTQEMQELLQKIEQKKIELNRLNQESNALQNKYQNKINIQFNNNQKYNILQLCDTNSRQNIIKDQLKSINDYYSTKQSQAIQIQNEIIQNDKLNISLKKLQQDIQTKKQLLNIKNDNNDNINALTNQLESLKRLLSIKQLDINSKCNELLIKFQPNNSMKIYLIQMNIKLYQNNDNNTAFDITNVQVTQEGTNTKFKHFTEKILSKYVNNNNDNDDDMLISIPHISIKKVVMEILLILRKLPRRYEDINKLYSIYGKSSDDSMYPWIPENPQLVFKFPFNQIVNDINIAINVPLIIFLSWNYPQLDIISDDSVIIFEHYNVEIGDIDDNNNRILKSEIELKWKNILQKTINSVNNNYQNDIIAFINAIHTQLKDFADIPLSL